MYSSKSIELDYDALVQNVDSVLDYVFRRADSFSIVTDLIKPYSALPPRCKQDKWTAELQRDMVSQTVRAREWPGTTTRSLHKVLSFYKACSRTKAVVKAWPNAFLALESVLPEDICFYRNGEFWFGTTSHEVTASVLIFSAEDETFFRPFDKYRL